MFQKNNFFDTCSVLFCFVVAAMSSALLPDEAQLFGGDQEDDYESLSEESEPEYKNQANDVSTSDDELDDDSNSDSNDESSMSYVSSRKRQKVKIDVPGSFAKPLIDKGKELAERRRDPLREILAQDIDAFGSDSGARQSHYARQIIEEEEYGKHRRKQKTHVSTKNVNRSAPVSRKVMKKVDQRITKWMGAANVAYVAQQYQDCLATLRRVIERDPEFDGAYHTMAMCYEDLGDTVAALKNYMRAAELERTNPGAWRKGGELAASEGFFKNAAVCFRRLLKLRRRDAFALAKLGHCLWQSKDFKNAARYLRRALDIAPASLGAAIDLARVHSDEHNREEAALVLKRALHDYRNVHGDDVDAWNQDRLGAVNYLAQVLIALGKPDEAIAYIVDVRRCVAAELPFDLRISFAVAKVYTRDVSGDADRYLASLLERGVEEYYDLYDMAARAFADIDECGRALQYFEPLVDADCVDEDAQAATWRHMAVCYTATGQRELTVRYLEQLAELEPDDPVPHTELASHYALMGRADESAEALRRSEQLQAAKDAREEAKRAEDEARRAAKRGSKSGGGGPGRRRRTSPSAAARRAASTEQRRHAADASVRERLKDATETLSAGGTDEQFIESVLAVLADDNYFGAMIANGRVTRHKAAAAPRRVQYNRVIDGGDGPDMLDDDFDDDEEAERQRALKRQRTQGERVADALGEASTEPLFQVAAQLQQQTTGLLSADRPLQVDEPIVAALPSSSAAAVTTPKKKANDDEDFVPRRKRQRSSDANDDGSSEKKKKNNDDDDDDDDFDDDDDDDDDDLDLSDSSDSSSPEADEMADDDGSETEDEDDWVHSSDEDLDASAALRKRIKRERRRRRRMQRRAAMRKRRIRAPGRPRADETPRTFSALGSYDATASLMIDLIGSLIRVGRLRDARLLIEKYCSVVPAFRPTLPIMHQLKILEAWLYSVRGKWAVACDLLRDAAVREPSNVALWSMLNRVLDAMANEPGGDTGPRMVAPLKRAFEKHPSSAIATIRAEAACRKGSYRMAINYYLTALNLPHAATCEPAIYLRIAICYMHEHTNRSAQHRAAILLQALGWLQRYRSRAANPVEADYNIGRAFHHIARNAEASRHYARVLAADTPAGFPSLKAEAAHNLAQIFAQQGRVHAARDLIQRYFSFD
jgi:tetratricopeptide (TPR) repeat protein